MLRVSFLLHTTVFFLTVLKKNKLHNTQNKTSMLVIEIIYLTIIKIKRPFDADIVLSLGRIYHEDSS